MTDTTDVGPGTGTAADASADTDPPPPRRQMLHWTPDAAAQATSSTGRETGAVPDIHSVPVRTSARRDQLTGTLPDRIRMAMPDLPADMQSISGGR